MLAHPRVKNHRSVILLLISLALVCAFLYYLYTNADRYIELVHLSAVKVILILILTFGQQILNGEINIYTLRILGINLSHKESFHIASASTLANQLPISGGIIIKGVYLKKKYGLSYIKYASVTLAIFFLTVASYGLLSELILFYWKFYKNIPIEPSLLLGFSIMSFGLLIFIVPFERITIPSFAQKWLHQALDGWAMLKEKPILLLQILFLQTIMTVFLALRYLYAFQMLSQNISLSQSILFSSASVLTQLASFAPGGLGVQEVIVAGVASTLGFETSVSIAAVGLNRLIATVVIVITGWVSATVLGKQISDI